MKPTTLKESLRFSITLITSEASSTIKQESTKPEPEESSSRTVNSIYQYEGTEALNMIAYHHQQLSERYSQLAAAISNLAVRENYESLGTITASKPKGLYDLCVGDCTP